MLVADNLCKCNDHFRGKAAFWKQQGVDSRDIRARVANRPTRIVFQLVSGKTVYRHPCRLGKPYLMDKLEKYCREYRMPPEQTLKVLHAAAEQIPLAARAAEAGQIQQRWERTRRKGRNQPDSIGTLLTALLAKLGVVDLQSNTSEAGGSD